MKLTYRFILMTCLLVSLTMVVGLYAVHISGQALAESIENELRSKRIKTSGAEGLQEGKWVVIDFHDVVVHVFYHEQRDFYDLEGLWHDAPRIESEP